MTTTPIRFKIISFQPDKRQYKTAMPLLEPEQSPLLIVIDLPFDHEHVYNYEDIALKQLSGESVPDVQLTPKGWACVEDQLLNRIDQEKEPENNQDIEWEGD